MDVNFEFRDQRLTGGESNPELSRWLTLDYDTVSPPAL